MMTRNKSRTKCAIDGCRRRTVGIKSLCSEHWYALPEGLRTEFWNTLSARHPDLARIEQRMRDVFASEARRK